MDRRELLCERGGVFTFGAFRTDAKSRRRYVQALEYAHRHARTSTHPRRNHGLQNPHHHLAKWLASHLREIAPRVQVEASPPDWGDENLAWHEGPDIPFDDYVDIAFDDGADVPFDEFPDDE